MTSTLGDRCRFRPPETGATVIWEVTDFCNLACTHCLSDSSPERSRQDDLETARMISAVREMTEAGVTEFYFSGGEPFAREDFSDIIAAVDPGVAEVYCNTNGYYVTPEVAGALAGTALRRMTVSIDGHDRAAHALVRGKPSSFDRAVAAVQHLLAANVPVRVSHVVHPGNVDHVEEFCATMARIGVDALLINSVFLAGRAARHPQLLLPSERQQDLFDELTALQDQYAQRGIQIDHSLGTPEPNDTPGCPAGRRVFHVAPNGDLSTCSWLYKLDPDRFRLGNLKTSSYAKLLPGVEPMMGPVRALAACRPLPVMGS
ncbi:radical SAM protein [Streptomyces sp. MP131-18]|uniref:radical SAM/SPASM domain-containing protein n=1 Tax=Streptomyces sp. MP131-18 TaxID=1857892 RepID=UPI00097BC75C|nr:radical SAM protein [Streptomyces sp. MP131-18]ONK13166.1 Antilisterial bacteriocin subtilosin biosynthesis protein AlbA [Streptomyces sp. MP131-18]